MKLKKFFADNKEKILKFLKFTFVLLITWLLTIFTFLLGYNFRDNLDSTEDTSKKELVNRKEAYNFIENEFNSSNDTFMICGFKDYQSLGECYLFLNINYIILDYSVGSREAYLYIEYDIYARYYDNSNWSDWVQSDILYNTETEFIIEVRDGINEDIASIGILIDFYNLAFDGGYVSSVDGGPKLDITLDLMWDITLNPQEEITYSSTFYPNYSFTLDFSSVRVDYIPLVQNFLFNLDDVSVNYKRGYYNSVVFNYTSSVVDSIYQDGYNVGKDVGYEEGYQAGLPKNIFYYNVEKDTPILLVLDDTSWIQPDNYDETLLFKNNYLDLQYLRDLYSGQYSKFRVIFTDSLYSLKDLYLSLDNSSLNDYNILVNGKAYTINSSGTLNIPSSELLQAMEFDSSLLDSTRLINASPDYANGFNNGYQNGYDNGYDEGEVDQEDYYEELIIPSIKDEWFGNGYQEGLAEGRAENNAILKPFELMILGVEPMITVLSSEIAPGITIGTIALIPLAVTMIVFLLKGLVM